MNFESLQLDTTTVAAIITAVGGILVKIIERWAMKHKVSNEDHIKITNELRQENMQLKNELNIAKNETDDWREKYWSEREKDFIDDDTDSGTSSTTN